MKKGLTGNALKLIALIVMTVDHIGVQLFPEIKLLRIIGRLALPIFAYMIAEGCKYTKNRRRYLGLIALEALICQLVYLIAMGSLYMCILVTFSLSILLIYIGDFAVKKKSTSGYIALVTAIIAVFAICELLPKALPNTDFQIDYGFFGVLMPVVLYFSRDDKLSKLSSITAMCVLLGLRFGGVMYFNLLAIPLLTLYNGERGKHKMKYLFYIYYPLHLVIIYAISLFI